MAAWVKSPPPPPFFSAPTLALSQTVLRRFLKARKWDVDAAATMLSNYYTWRETMGDLGVKDIINVIRMGCFYFSGRALDGTPLVVIPCSRSVFCF